MWRSFLMKEHVKRWRRSFVYVEKTKPSIKMSAIREVDGRRLGRREELCGEDEWKQRDERRIRGNKTRGEKKRREDKRLKKRDSAT